MTLTKKNIVFILLALLLIIYTSITYLNKMSDDTIALRVVWVINDQLKPITKQQQVQWLKRIRQFYFDEANIRLDFKDKGQLGIDDFFKNEFDLFPKGVEFEEKRFDFVRSDFNSSKEAIIKELRKMKISELRRLAHNQKAISYQDFFEIVKDNYLKEIVLFKDILSKERSTYNSASNWLYILQNTDKYDLVFTNEIILNDSYDPYSSNSILNGAIVPGFAVPEKAVISTALLTQYPQEYHDKIALYYAVHEVGHALFYISHSNSESMHIMGLSRNSFWQDIERTKLTDKERELIKIGILIREGKKSYEQHDYTRAIEKYSEALARDPNCYLCSYFLSQVHCELHDYGSCASYLELTTRLNPKWSLPYEILGDIYIKHKFGLKFGGIYKAIEKYKKVVEFDPSNITLRLKLAKCYEEVGERRKAEKEYLAVIRIEPANSSALQALTNLRAKRRPKE